ncbi:hypothetical protein ACNUDN_08405 [Mycobacterium sp. smrl_JER01]|uniref:hypothetical protein n=1 Tax=Mycobacterium sp. smrl_JER01 TaxID=3402633 RepID=UPI003ACED29D
MRREDPVESHVDSTLRSIERRVLGEVWIGSPRAGAGSALAVTLGIVALASATYAYRLGHAAALIADSLFLAAALISLAALTFRRFIWCCAAAYLCGIATVTGVGAFWWYRTAEVDSAPVSTALGCLLAAALTLGWLSVLLTPVQRSQPDMRQRHRRQRH